MYSRRPHSFHTGNSVAIRRHRDTIAFLFSNNIYGDSLSHAAH